MPPLVQALAAALLLRRSFVQRAAALAGPEKRVDDCAGASEHDLLVRIVEMLGPMPGHLLANSQNARKFFRKVDVPSPDAQVCWHPAAACCRLQLAS